MKKLTRKLFISILAAVFAVVALGTSTFAWITISNTATVEAFEGKVEAGEAGIELKLEGEKDWKSSIQVTASDLTNFGFKEFADITSNDGRTFNEWVISEGKEAKSQSVTNAKYIEFDITIRISNPVDDNLETPEVDETSSLDIYVSDAKVDFATTVGDGTFTPDVTGLGTTKKNILVSNAARLSLDNATEAPIVYEQKAATNENTEGFSKDEFAYQYLVKKGFKEYTSLDHGNLPNTEGVPASITAQATRKAGDTGEAKLCTIKGKEEKTITVRVWVEGWDNECHHNILGQTLSTTFAFSSKATPGK